MVLDSLEEVLDFAGVNFTRLDGNTKSCERGDILHRFGTDSAIEVLLLSVRSGGVRSLHSRSSEALMKLNWTCAVLHPSPSPDLRRTTCGLVKPYNRVSQILWLGKTRNFSFCSADH